MKVNYNVSAHLANKRLLGIENNMATSMERLSSGLKINHAKDNPAGMAISKKMQAQINGLNRASQNASDGISVIQIADGALNEVTSILQRMRELSVQAASTATVGLEDRQAIQAEIDSLKEEINRISTDTEYNTKTLLDGSLDTRVYTDNASRVQVSDYLEAGTYGISIEKAAMQATIEATGANFNDATSQIGQSGGISINGSSVTIEATDTYEQVYEKIREAAAVGDATVTRDEASGALTFSSNLYGKQGLIEISFSNQDLANAIGLVEADGNRLIMDPNDSEMWVYGQLNADGTAVEVPTGENVEFKKDANGKIEMQGFTNSATVATNGNRIEITDIGGASISFLADAGYEGELEFEVTELGTMTLHVGANKDQNMEVRISEVSSKSLFVDDVDVTTLTGGTRAISSFDEAIAQVSSVRARLGAYENRLEYAVNSLDAFEENMTGALSRLTDVDMADEMTEYTHQNVLNQAAISVLSQANDIPQQILQILS